MTVFTEASKQDVSRVTKQNPLGLEPANQLMEDLTRDVRDFAQQAMDLAVTSHDSNAVASRVSWSADQIVKRYHISDSEARTRLERAAADLRKEKNSKR